MSLGAELSTDYDERTRLASVRGFFRQAGTLTVTLVGFGIFFQAGNGYQNGQLNPDAYPPFSLFIVICLVTTLLMSAVGTHGKIPLLPRASDTHERFRWMRLLREVRDAARIPSFRYMILSLLTYNSIMGMHGALALYVVTFFWVVSPTDIMFITPASMLGNVLGASLGSVVTRRIGEKRSAAMLGIAWYAVWSSSMPTLRLLDLAPLHGDPWLVPLIAITGVLGGLGMGVAIVAKNAMLADVTDEHEWRYGARQEGIYFSSYLFAEKAVSGVGIVLAGLALEYLGLESSATPDTVPAGVVQGLGILFGPATFVVLFLPIALLLGYRITRARHAEIRRALEAGERPSFHG
jgi:Na+/melibiose symporter-like transporter